MSADAQPSDLKIHEVHSLALIESPDTDADGIFNADGTVNVAVLRPCEGRGPGGRIYSRELLESTASMWSGYASYLNHEDPKARKLSGKLRRGPDELAGELRETVWDSTYTTPDDDKYGYQPGAVIGKFMPASELVEGLIRRIPGQLKLSINAQATSMRRAKRSDGKPGWLVEGIEDDPENGSVDLVTAAGAGGHVRSLMESVYGPDHDPSATDGLAELTDDQLVEWLTEHRPQVLNTGDPDVTDMTLQEALATPEVKGYIGEMVKEGIAAGIQEALPAAIEAERTRLQESVRDELGETARTRALHTEAMRLIEAAKLPKSAKDELRLDYSLEDIGDGEQVKAGPSLALIEAVTDNAGAVTKTAKQVLAEQIDARAKRLRNMLREAAPTMPHAPGGGHDDNGAEPEPANFGGEGSNWADLARRRGLDPGLFGATAAPAGN